MKVLILAAGSDDAFAHAGYHYPKNLVEIDGRPLVERVLHSLAPMRVGDTTFIVCIREEEARRFHTDATIRLLMPEAIVVGVPTDTKGAACTALLAIDSINSDEPLTIVNGDIILDVDYKEVRESFAGGGLDGGVIVFESVHPRWSFVKCNASGLVIEAAEKRPISNLATVGFYYFARGSQFVTACMNMIKKDAHVEGVFYVCPVFNEMILERARIGVYKITREAYFSLKTPQDVSSYEERIKSRMRWSG